MMRLTTSKSILFVRPRWIECCQGSKPGPARARWGIEARPAKGDLLWASHENSSLKPLVQSWMLQVPRQNRHMARNVAGQFAHRDNTIMVFIRVLPQCLQQDLREGTVPPVLVFARELVSCRGGQHGYIAGRHERTQQI